MLTLVPVLAYTVLAGAETATIRSAIMIAVALWTVWLGSPHYLLHALAAAAGLTLLVHPAALFDISFQLSYVSVWALALALSRETPVDELPLPKQSPAGRMVYWFRESLRLTALVTLATVPLVACYFNQVSWMGLFANLLMVPFVGFIFLPTSLLSAVWVIVTHSSTLPGAAFIDSPCPHRNSGCTSEPNCAAPHAPDCRAAAAELAPTTAQTEWQRNSWAHHTERRPVRCPYARCASG